MASQRPPKLSDAEWEIMNIIWDRGESTVLDVLAAINGSREEKVGRTTVQVQMTRLEEKGWLTYRTEDRTYYYKPTQCREYAASRFVRDATARVFGGSGAELVRALFSNVPLSKKEIEELRGILDSYKGE